MAESSGRPCLCRSEKEPVAAGQIMEVFFLNGGRLGEIWEEREEGREGKLWVCKMNKNLKLKERFLFYWADNSVWYPHTCCCSCVLLCMWWGQRSTQVLALRSHPLPSPFSTEHFYCFPRQLTSDTLITLTSQSFQVHTHMNP